MNSLVAFLKLADIYTQSAAGLKQNILTMCYEQVKTYSQNFMAKHSRKIKQPEWTSHSGSVFGDALMRLHMAM
jgi:hypothetical protein